MKITFRKISTKDLATLAKRTLESSKKGRYSVIKNHQLLLDVETQYNKYDKVYSKSTYSGMGADVAKADELRDKLFSNLKQFLNGYKAIETMPNSADAAYLYSIFEKYGLNIDRLSYAEESAQMVKLIEELSKADNIAKLTALNAMPTFEKMKNAQVDFEETYAKQAEANADLHSLPSASSIRRDLEQALRNYYSLLTVMQDVEGWKMIYSDIKELVKGIHAAS